MIREYDIDRLIDKDRPSVEDSLERIAIRAEEPSGQVREGSSLFNCMDCVRHDCSGCPNLGGGF